MKSLCFICQLLVLSGMAVSLIREYVYVSQSMSWTNAQDYCRQMYGNVASITTEEENQRAVTVAGKKDFVAWIGLERVIPHGNIWKWCDGEKSNYTHWNPKEPNDGGEGENCAVIKPQGWCDTSCGGTFSTFCSRRFTLVKEKKTWEEALQYCRSNYTGLAFVDSETLLNLLQTETEQAQTASVWTGLRFLHGTWFWVNRTFLESPKLLPSCPVKPYRCGAYNFNTSVWENRDCNEKLNFLCYY